MSRERDPARQERAERLAGRAREVHADRVVRQSGAAVAQRHLVAEHGANGAVDVADGQRQLHALTSLDRVAAGGDQRRVVE